jgi:hypothetical protein
MVDYYFCFKLLTCVLSPDSCILLNCGSQTEDQKTVPLQHGGQLFLFQGFDMGEDLQGGCPPTQAIGVELSLRTPTSSRLCLLTMQ